MYIFCVKPKKEKFSKDQYHDERYLQNDPLLQHNTLEI